MLHLMQINIAGSNERIAPFDQRLAKIVALAEQNTVDIITLQAAEDARGASLPLDRLRAVLPALPHVARNGSMALLSRRPLAAARAVALASLSHADDPHARALLIVHLADPALVVAVAHFSWVGAQAEANVAETIAALAGLGATILAGDFNQPPHSPALAALAAAGFADPWPRLNTGPGITFAESDPPGRIDYVLERAPAPLVREIGCVAGDFSNHAALIARVAA